MSKGTLHRFIEQENGYSWKNTKNELPEERTIVYAKTEDGRVVLCQFLKGFFDIKNCSLAVESWKYAGYFRSRNSHS